MSKAVMHPLKTGKRGIWKIGKEQMSIIKADGEWVMSKNFGGIETNGIVGFQFIWMHWI